MCSAAFCPFLSVGFEHLLHSAGPISFQGVLPATIVLIKFNHLLISEFPIPSHNIYSTVENVSDMDNTYVTYFDYCSLVLRQKSVVAVQPERTVQLSVPARRSRRNYLVRSKAVQGGPRRSRACLLPGSLHKLIHVP